jgi:hypothetical protein
VRNEHFVSAPSYTSIVLVLSSQSPRATEGGPPKPDKPVVREFLALGGVPGSLTGDAGAPPFTCAVVLVQLRR